MRTFASCAPQIWDLLRHPGIVLPVEVGEQLPTIMESLPESFVVRLADYFLHDDSHVNDEADKSPPGEERGLAEAAADPQSSERLLRALMDPSLVFNFAEGRDQDEQSSHAAVQIEDGDKEKVLRELHDISRLLIDFYGNPVEPRDAGRWSDRLLGLISEKRAAAESSDSPSRE
jgi:hypothetical protein